MNRKIQTKKEAIPYEIGDTTYVVGLLGELYKNPLDAFKEHISNSYDANSTQIGIITSRKENKVVVIDDGDGIDYKEMQRIPKSIGSSEKRGDRALIGEKGIAILGYQTYAESCEVLSRPRGKDHFVRLRMSRDNPKFAELTFPSEDELPAEQRYTHGTGVTVKGINDRDMDRYFKKERIKSEMRDMFDYLLRKGDLKIRVGYYTKRGPHLSEVQPINYRGTLVLDESVDMDFGGKTEFYIFVDPKGVNEKVRVCNRAKILDSITQLEEFQKEPWNSGNLTGYINADFLKLTASRDALVRNRQFEQWCDTIRDFEDQLFSEVQRLKIMKDKEERDEILDEVINAIAFVYRKTQLGPEILVRGGTDDKERKIIETGFKGATRVGEEREKEPKKEGRQVLVESQDGETTRVRRGRLSFPYNCEFTEFAPGKQYMRSDLDMIFNKILINEGHDDYRKEFKKKDKTRIKRYLIYLISKEAAVADFIKRVDAHTSDPQRDIHYISEREDELFCQAQSVLKM